MTLARAAGRRGRHLVRALPAVARSGAGWREEWSLARVGTRPEFTPGRSTVLGRPVSYTHPQSFVAQYREIFQHHAYGFASDRSDPLILDCGANIGMATLYWKIRYPAARVVCFEPDPALFAVLQTNLSCRDLTDVEVHQAAVWSSQGALTFAVQGAGGGHLGAGDLVVPTVRLADVLAARCADDHIDLLKIDIEGAEAEVLTDCSSRLEGVRRLFVEYHELGRRFQQLGPIVGILTSAGFRMTVRHEVAPTAPFLAGRDTRGMQLNIWAWREPQE